MKSEWNGWRAGVAAVALAVLVAGAAIAGDGSSSAGLAGWDFYAFGSGSTAQRGRWDDLDVAHLQLSESLVSPAAVVHNEGLDGFAVLDTGDQKLKNVSLRGEVATIADFGTAGLSATDVYLGQDRRYYAATESGVVICEPRGFTQLISSGALGGSPRQVAVHNTSDGAVLWLALDNDDLVTLRATKGGVSEIGRTRLPARAEDIEARFWEGSATAAVATGAGLLVFTNPEELVGDYINVYTLVDLFTWCFEACVGALPPPSCYSLCSMIIVIGTGESGEMREVHLDTGATEAGPRLRPGSRVASTRGLRSSRP